MKVSQVTKSFLNYHRLNSKKNTLRNYLHLLTEFSNQFGERQAESLTSEETLSFLSRLTEGLQQSNRPDGKGIRISAQQREPFIWEVKGDQVCVAPYHDMKHCWQYQHSKKNPEEYVRRDSKHGFMQIIKVENGIPEF